MADSSNVIEFIINAKDDAAKVFSHIKESINQTQVATSLAQAKFASMTLAIAQLSSTGITHLSRLQNIVVGIKNTLFDTTAGKTIVDQFNQAALEAVARTTKLSGIVSVAGKTLGTFAKEFTNLRSTSVVDDVGTRFLQSIQQQSNTLLDLARQYAPRIAQAFQAGESHLANAALEEVINRRIPGPLRASLEFAGVDAGQSLVSLLQSEEQIRNLVNSDALNQLLSGSLVGGVQSVISNRLTSVFRTGFAQLNSFITEAARTAGENAGRNFVTGAETNFQRFDRLSGGVLRSLTDSISSSLQDFIPANIINDIAATLTNDLSTSIFNLLPSTVGESFTRFISGFLTTRITRAVSVAAGRAFENGIATGFSNVSPDALSGIQALTTVIGNLFPNTRRLAESLKLDISGNFVEFLRSLSLPGIQRANEDLANLTARLEALGDVDIDSLTAEGTRLFRDGNLDAQGQARLDQILAQIDEIESINIAIADAESRLDEFAANNARREELETQRVELLLELEDPDAVVEDIEFVLDLINQELQTLDDGLRSPIERFFTEIRSDLSDLFGQEFVDNLETNLRTAFSSIDRFFDGVFGDALREVGVNAGNAFAAGFASQVGAAIAPTLDLIDETIRGSINAIKSIPSRFEQPLSQFGGGLAILAGIRDPLDVFSLLKENTQAVFVNLARIGEQLTFFSSGISVLHGLVQNGPFRLLIGQNIELREQLLATQASLVSTQKITNVFTNQAISNNTQAIQSLTLPIRKAIKEMRRDSLDLVGVTSNQLIESFQIMAAEAGGMNASLTNVKDLTIAFAAAMGTLRIPLFQSRQEITSIVQGTIDMNSALAKSIGLTNPMIRQWKSQGVLVDKLLEKLSGFVAGNKLAANSVSGLTSNIQEVLENIGLAAGESLVDPIVAELNKVFTYLNKQADAITKTVKRISTIILNGVRSVVEGLRTVFGASQKILTALPNFFGTSIGKFLKIFGEALISTTEILRPFIKVIGEVASALRPIGSPMLKFAVQAFVLSRGIKLLSSIFGTFAQILPGIGELLFGVNIRMLPIVNLLPTLTSQLGLGAGGFLALGQSLHAIPGAAAAATQFLSKFLGPFAPLVASLIPKVASLGIQLVGLSTIFPPLRSGIASLLASNPTTLLRNFGLALKALPFASTIPLISQMGDRLIGLSGTLAAHTGATTVSALATEQFNLAMRHAAIAVRGFLINSALIAGALYAVFKAFDHFILQNEKLLDVITGVIGGVIHLTASLTEWITSNLFVNIAVAVASAGFAIGIFHTALGALIATKIGAWAIFTANSLIKLGNAIKYLAFTDTLFSLRSALFGASTATNALNASTRLLSFSGIAQGAILAGTTLKTMAAQMLAGTYFAGGFSVALTKLKADLIALGAGLFAALAPLALIAAGVAAIGYITHRRVREASNEILAVSQDATNRISIEAAKKAEEVNKLLDEQEHKRTNGIALSEKELEANRKALHASKSYANGLQLQIDILEDRKHIEEDSLLTNKEAVRFYEEQIQKLQKQKEEIDEINNQVSISNKDLDPIGSVFVQMTEKLKTLEQAIDKSDGNADKFKANVDEYIQLIGTMIEQGAITAEEGERLLLKVTNNSVVLSESQIKARQALLGVYSAEEEQLGRLQQKTRDLLEIAEQDRLLNSRRKYALADDPLKLQEEQLASQIETTKLELKQGEDRLKQHLDQQDRLAKATKTAQEILQQEIVKANQEAAAEIDQLLEKEFGEKEYRPNIDAIGGTEYSDKIKAQIEAIQDGAAEKIKVLEQEQQNTALLNEKQRTELEKKVQEEIKRTYQTQDKLLGDQIKAFELSIARRKQILDRLNLALKNDTQEQNQILQQQLSIYQSIERSLSIQLDLERSQQQLVTSSASLMEKQIQYLASGEKSEFRRKKLIESAAATRLKGLLASQLAEQRNLEIQQAQNRLALEREAIQNRIAKAEQISAIAQSQAELVQAQADPRRTSQEVRAIELKLSADVDKLANLDAIGNLIEKQFANNEESNRLAKENLAVTQQSQLFDAQRELLPKIVDKNLRKAFDRSLKGEALKSLGDATGQTFRNNRDLLRSINPFAREVITSQITSRKPTAQGFIELPGGKKININDLNQKPESFAVLEDGSKVNFGQTEQIKKSFIDFGDKIEKVTSVPKTQAFAPQVFDPKNLPSVDIQSITNDITENFKYFRSGVNDIVNAIKNQQTSATYNINISVPKIIKQVQGTVENVEEVNLNNVLDKAKALAGGI